MISKKLEPQVLYIDVFEGEPLLTGYIYQQKEALKRQGFVNIQVFTRRENERRTSNE